MVAATDYRELAMAVRNRHAETLKARKYRFLLAVDSKFPLIQCFQLLPSACDCYNEESNRERGGKIGDRIKIQFVKQVGPGETFIHPGLLPQPRPNFARDEAVCRSSVGTDTFKIFRIRTNHRLLAIKLNSLRRIQPRDRRLIHAGRHSLPKVHIHAIGLAGVNAKSDTTKICSEYYY
jgi:hypothetical protein